MPENKHSILEDMLIFHQACQERVEEAYVCRQRGHDVAHVTFYVR